MDQDGTAESEDDLKDFESPSFFTYGHSISPCPLRIILKLAMPSK
jgi:hypothetical protein